SLLLRRVTWGRPGWRALVWTPVVVAGRRTGRRAAILSGRWRPIEVARRRTLLGPVPVSIIPVRARRPPVAGESRTTGMRANDFIHRQLPVAILIQRFQRGGGVGDFIRIDNPVAVGVKRLDD